MRQSVGCHLARTVTTIVNSEPKRRPYNPTGFYVNLWALIGVVVSLTGLLVLTLYRGEIAALDARLLYSLLSLYIGGLLAFTIRATSGNIWAPSSVYLCMLALFHFGAVATYAAGQNSDSLAISLDRWLFNPWTPDASVLAAIGITSCAFGIFITGTGASNRHESKNLVVARSERSFSYYLSWVGFIMVVSGVLGWFFLAIQAGGFGLLVGSYADYLLATSESGTGYIWVLLGAGLAFLAASQRSSTGGLHLIAFTCFGLFALFALPLGLRGEVLFTTLGALVVRARQGYRPSTKATIVGALVVLVLISVIREVRQVGIASAPAILTSGGLFDGAAELGSTLRPVVEVLDWERPAEPGQRGATYWAPIDRALCRILPARECVVPIDDDRLMNVVVRERSGPIGFSPIAEAYENFREPGIIIVMSLIGLLVGSLNKLSDSTLSNALVGLIMVELLINVRNAFTAVPTHLMFGIFCLLIAWLLTKTFPLTAALGSNRHASKDRQTQSRLA